MERTMASNRFSAAAAAFLVVLGGAAALSGCATLECDDLCSPAEAAAQAPLVVEPLDYDVIFGPPRTGRIWIDGVPAQAPSKPDRRRAGRG